jgi:hypothetical protein
VPKARNH